MPLVSIGISKYQQAPWFQIAVNQTNKRKPLFTHCPTAKLTKGAPKLSVLQHVGIEKKAAGGSRCFLIKCHVMHTRQNVTK